MDSNAAAGWYDDGAGTRRYWDGTRWTEPAVQEGGAAEAASAGAARPQNVLGYLGLGLAVLALIGVSLPTMLLEAIGGVLLLAAFVLSIVALSRPGARWPAIVGIGICFVAVVAAAVFFVVGFMNGYAGAVSG
ncbi:DUF2510 domain-containing protein [Agromyces italicus]|uniref:DUF2510 domain-containing protein n=1 Tax=Agromyces italicus TaxID=279572 RepID=UPI0003B4F8B5|nr:DUF2510 domain-containing protein [Agromyces italicus]